MDLVRRPGDNVVARLAWKEVLCCGGCWQASPVSRNTTDEEGWRTKKLGALGLKLSIMVYFEEWAFCNGIFQINSFAITYLKTRNFRATYNISK